MAYSGKYSGSRIIGGNGICAVYSESSRTDEQSSGIIHYYIDNYENDYIKYCLPKFKLNNQSENRFGSEYEKRNFADVIINFGPFYVETKYNSLINPDVNYSYKVYSNCSGIIIFDILINNRSRTEISVGIKLDLRFREKVSEIYYKNSVNIYKLNNINLTAGIIYNVENENSNGKSNANELAQLTKIGSKKNCNVKFFISPESNKIIFNELNFEKVEEEWKRWLECGTKIKIKNENIKKIYESCIIAIAATSLKGAVPADMTGQFLTNGKPQLYPRDALMTARALIEAGYYSVAEDILNFWNKEIPQKSEGEWFARYDAYKKAVDGGSGAAFDLPEWDSNGYYASLMLRLFMKTGNWTGSYELMKELLDFILREQNGAGLVEEGGIVEQVGLLPATNMSLIAGLNQGAIICDLNNESEKADGYRRAAEKMKKGLSQLFSKARGAYMDYQGGIEKFNTSLNFGFVWGYPDSVELALTNGWYEENVYKLGGGVQYFEAEGYGSDLFGFTTGASAQYNVYTGETERYIKHIIWMLDHSNIYGMMPERIFFPDGKEVSLASPLSWCNGEFVASVFKGAVLNNKFITDENIFSIDFLISECEGFNRIINKLDKNLSDEFGNFIIQSKREFGFNYKLKKLYQGLQIVKKNKKIFQNTEIIFKRLNLIFNRIICNELDCNISLNTIKKFISSDEIVELKVSGSFPLDFKVTELIIEYLDGNASSVCDSEKLNLFGNFEKKINVKYTNIGKSFETGIRVRAKGIWNKIPVDLGKTIRVVVK